MPSCLRLLVHDMRLAASRTCWMAGRSRPTRTPMIAMTTSNSISVKALRLGIMWISIWISERLGPATRYCTLHLRLDPVHPDRRTFVLAPRQDHEQSAAFRVEQPGAGEFPG